MMLSPGYGATRWRLSVFLRTLLLLASSGCFGLLAETARIAHAAGFDLVKVPVDDATTATAGIWYPSDAPTSLSRFGPWSLEVAPGARIVGSRLPLVIISHGTSGWFGGHHGMAAALADAGFIVAALSHPGDNAWDQSGLVGQKRFLDRPRHIDSLLRFVTEDWHAAGHLDAERIGMVGYSIGGTTALMSAGGRPDFKRLRPHCEAAMEPICSLLMPQWSALEGSTATVARGRIRALVLAAPALGVLFDPASVARVDVPTQVWRADRDEILTAPHHADRIAAILPGQVDLRSVPGAGHYAFLPPCPETPPAAAREICTDPADFDRGLFHREFNASVTRFLSRHLR